MSALWKLSAPLSPKKDPSQPLELVRCIGKAIYKTDSGITGAHMENSKFAKLTKKQTKGSIRSKPGNLRPNWSYQSMSQLAVYPRLGTVNAEKWWSTEMSGWDLSERTKSCHRFKSPSRRPSPAFWVWLPTHPGSPLPGLSIPRIQSLKTPMAAGLHGPCVLQCVGFATGRGDAEQEKSCNSDMNSQHFGIFARGSCRSRHGGQFGSLRSKVALTSMGAPRQSTISTIAHRRACCISDMQGLHVEERDSSLFKGTKPSGSSPAGSHTEISLLNS
ncbi:uncharacterized protein LOC125720556 isoform X2 [Brienomyrus brachyistius]|uniref:uncharacterized protein LOC125720556 isoform X2 n=1 Tax=Brienomyrus brachyistius TaxID=42636 RepID=UPI0020B42783|nr:uncharacterized protein LOC125720556 isoform X2 [Brienomyrus brachyistius]